MSANILDFGQVQRPPLSSERNLLERLAQSQSHHVSNLAAQVHSNFQFLQKKLSAAPEQITDAVLIDPAIMHGNPVFRGTRIPLYQIVEELADGTSFEELTEGYPSLTPETIRSGLDFVSSLLRLYDEDVSY